MPKMPKTGSAGRLARGKISDQEQASVDAFRALDTKAAIEDVILAQEEAEAEEAEAKTKIKKRLSKKS